MVSIFIATLLGITAVQASPTLISRQSITALMTSQIDTFFPYTYFASAAYCTSLTTLSWLCGGRSLCSLFVELCSELDTFPCTVDCDKNAGFETVALGGDGNGVQYCELYSR